MRIGEVAERVGVNPKTIRFYESIGVLPEPPRTPSGYRDYEDEHVERLRFIKAVQRLGLKLEEIGEVSAFREASRRSGHCRRECRSSERVDAAGSRDSLLNRRTSLAPQAGRVKPACRSSERHGLFRATEAQRASAANSGLLGPVCPRLPRSDVPLRDVTQFDVRVL